MADESLSIPPSPIRAVVALVPAADPDWQPILHAPNQVVLYNPTSHAVTIRQSLNVPEKPHPPCPYCKQTLPLGFEPDTDVIVDDSFETLDSDPAYFSRANDYFQLLEIANETSSRPSSPEPIEARGVEGDSRSRSAFPAEKMAEGYFKSFFQEEYKLGMGANGSVFLCQV